MVAFTDLALDVDGQRAFLVDVEGLESAARAQAKQVLETARADLRDDFLSYLEDGESLDYEEEAAVWRAYQERFLNLGLGFPPSPRRRSALQRWGRLIRTALSGEVRGWNLKNLPQVAHIFTTFIPDCFSPLANCFGLPVTT